MQSNCTKTPKQNRLRSVLWLRVGVNSRSRKSPILLGFCRLYMLFGNKMANTILEQTGGTYTQIGDYLLPDLELPEEEKEANIGVWGMRHKRYLKQNHKVLYYNLLTSGKLNSYLVDIEQQAQDLFLRLVKDLAEKENVTEELKSTDMMLWVQKMNNIRNCATEIVNAKMIYTV